MKATVVGSDGTVRCPKCGGTSFSDKRSGKAKWLAVPTVGVGVLAMPKHLKCNGCGEMLKRGDGKAQQPEPPPSPTLDKVDNALDRTNAWLDRHEPPPVREQWRRFLRRGSE